MGVISVLLAAAATWIFGAILYMVIGTRWMDASGLTEATSTVATRSPTSSASSARSWWPA
jgi:hypothetical protein